MDAAVIEQAFPGLAGTHYVITSPFNVNYNCLAWAAGREDAWWWPDPLGRGYWPEGIDRVATLDAFIKAFATLGYSPCEGEELIAGVEKIALYAVGDMPTHAARQLSNGRWSSKLGKSVDIEHELHALAGVQYGQVAAILSRAAAAVS